MEKTFTKLWATIFCLSLLLTTTNFSHAAARHFMATDETPDSCYIQTLPYSQNFDDTIAFPACWSGFSTAGNSYNCEISSYVNSQVTLPNSLYMTTSTGGTSIAVFSPIDREQININQLAVTFQARPMSQRHEATLQLGIITDPTRPETTFQRVDEMILMGAGSPTSFEEVTLYVRDYTDTGCYLALKWDTEVSSLLSVYIDNLVITSDSNCIPPRNVVLQNTTGESASISWDGFSSLDGGYLISYSETGSDNWQTQTSQTEQILLTGLNQTTNYSLTVQSLCGTDTSNAVSFSFYTTCNSYYDYIILDNDTVNIDGNNLPTRYDRNFSYTQQIYSAEELGNMPEIITGIALQYTHSNDMTRKIALYLGHTEDTVFQNNTSWISDSTLTKVFEGNITFTSTGENNWTPINFPIPFEYDGISNIVVAIDDNTDIDLPSSTPSYFQTLSGTQEQSIYHYNYYVNPSPSAPPAATGRSTYRNTIQFLACYASNCMQPQALTVSDITSSSATLSWVELGMVQGYELRYRKTGSTWNSISVYSTDTYLGELDPNTLYEVMLRGICAVEDTTDWASTSFTTECGSDTIPYLQNFDSYISNQLPACWRSIGTSSSNVPSVHREVNGSHYTSPSSSLTMRDSYTGAMYAIFPSFEANLPELQISFMAKTTDVASGTLTVGVMTDPELSSSFTDVATITPTQSNQWAEYTVRFDEYIDGGEYIAFKWENGDGNTFYIDDIAIDTIPACTAPLQLTLEQIDRTTATLSWSDTPDETWEIAYGINGFDPNVEGITVITQNNPHTLTSIESNTHYDFYIRRVCGTDNYSSWTGDVSGKTAQIPATIPYSSDFEDSTENRNWTMVNSTRNKWFIDTAANNTPGGSQSLYVSIDSGATNSYANYMMSSVWVYRDFCFPAGSLEGYMLAFDWKGKGQSNVDYLRVYIGAPATVTAGSNQAPANSTCLFSILNLNDTWRTDSISLNGHLPSDTCRLYFLWHNDGSNGENPPAAIDNISIRYSPCLAPTNIIIDTVDTETAKIYWDGENGTSWIVSYKAETDTVYQIDTVYFGSYDFQGLTSSTNYQVQIVSICGENRTSAIADTSFTTAEFIPDPVYYTITATADAGGSITPSGNIRILEGTDTTFLITPDEEYVIQSVLVNDVNVGNATTYTFRNVQGDSSIRVAFAVGISEIDPENTITLYPNPAQNFLTIKTEGNFENYTILNELGQIIRTANIHENSFQINIGELRSGIYFILFRGNGVVATEKFIKE